METKQSIKICITGGSGFIGMQLAKYFTKAGHSVLILDLHPPRENFSGVTFIQSNLVTDIPVDAFLSCDAVIHLAGVSIFGRWTPAYKKLILESRVRTAQALIDVVKRANKGPRVFVSASAIGYYGDGGEESLTEASPNGKDFLATVCGEWEAAAQTSETVGMRWVSVRTGIVLGPGGGMLSKLIPVFRAGLGGPLGNGNQWFSWIYIDDLIAIYSTAVFDESLKGPINATTPNPVRNNELTATIAGVLNRPAFFRVPGFILRFFLGELGSTLLMSQKVLPQKLLERGFSFSAGDSAVAIQKSL
jgi:uncharacterized protein (TIGR01777 family)